tara:strand:- start:508 stop:684 length:177 start_codon:yes stop_codon:yes gene_type:complete
VLAALSSNMKPEYKSEVKTKADGTKYVQVTRINVVETEMTEEQKGIARWLTEYKTNNV